MMESAPSQSGLLAVTIDGVPHYAKSIKPFYDVDGTPFIEIDPSPDHWEGGALVTAVEGGVDGRLQWAHIWPNVHWVDGALRPQPAYRSPRFVPEGAFSGESAGSYYAKYAINAAHVSQLED